MKRGLVDNGASLDVNIFRSRRVDCMGLFGNFFKDRKRKKQSEKWVRQKQGIEDCMIDLELPKWLSKWAMSVIEQEEEVRDPSEMSAWMEEKWLHGSGDLPDAFKEEEMLENVYREHEDWVEQAIAFLLDVRSTEHDHFSSLRKEYGTEISSMKEEAQKAYIAIIGELLNVVSQGMNA